MLIRSWISFVAGACVLLATQVHAQETVEGVFERIRGDWARLESGVSYEMDVTHRMLALSTTTPRPDGKGYLPGPLKKISPREAHYTVSVTVLGDSFLVRSFRDGKFHRAVEGRQGRFSMLNQNNEQIRAPSHPNEQLEDLFGFRAFVPSEARKEWADYPWLARWTDSRMKFDVEGGELHGDSAEVRVRMSYKPDAQGHPVEGGSLRRIRFARDPLLGWLPVRFERRHPTLDQTYSLDEVTWGSVALSSGPAAIPVRYYHRGTVLDPGTNQLMDVVETTWMIRQETIKLRTSASAQDPLWTQFSSPRAIAPAQVDGPPNPTRWYLLAFLFFVLLAVVLLYLRSRQTQARRA